MQSINHLESLEQVDLTHKQAWRWLLLILLIGFSLRAATTLALPMGVNNFSDDNAYLTSAITFLNTGYVTYSNSLVPTGVIGPGMPLVLGLLFALFGYQQAGLLAAHIAFACIGLITAIGIYRLGELLHSRKVGVIAAALVALDMGIISTNSAFYTETPYTCLVVFSLLYYLSCIREWKLHRFLLGTACLCGMLAFKGLALLVPLVIVLVLFHSRIRISQWLPKGLIALSLCALVLLPWCVRNLSVTGTFTPFPTSQGDQKLLGTYVGLGYPEGTYSEATTALDAEAWNQNYQDDKLRRIARRGEVAQQRINEWVQENPLAFLYTHLLYKPFALLVQPFYPDKIFGIPERMVRYEWWVLLGIAAFGVVSAKSSKRKQQKGFYVPLLFLSIAVPITAVFVPISRYNAPHAPFIMLYAAVGIVQMLSWMNTKTIFSKKLR